ncbi:MAG: hypothetical protein FJ135_11000 [Deltaproteobacteria bacterium]|nr:hypothetical protein [Deltaproteobacteria bacterium]
MAYLTETIEETGTFSSLWREDKTKFIREELASNGEKSTESHIYNINDTFSLGHTYDIDNNIKQNLNITETIREWWRGEVLEVNDEEGYFVALLKDRKGIESIAEFDISSAFDNTSEKNIYLFPGASFAFSVFTRHGYGAPEDRSRIEFNTPHIWCEDDELKSKELYNQLFPNDQPLED